MSETLEKLKAQLKEKEAASQALRLEMNELQKAIATEQCPFKPGQKVSYVYGTGRRVGRFVRAIPGPWGSGIDVVLQLIRKDGTLGSEFPVSSYSKPELVEEAS